MRRSFPITPSDPNSDPNSDRYLKLTNLSAKEEIPKNVTENDIRSAEETIRLRLWESSHAIEQRFQFRGRFFTRENGETLRLAGVRIGIPSLDFFSPPSSPGFFLGFAAVTIINTALLISLTLLGAIPSIEVLVFAMLINPIVVTTGPLLLSRAILFANALKIKRSLGEVATQIMEARVAAAEELELNRFPESAIRLPGVEINKIFSTKTTRLKYISEDGEIIRFDSRMQKISNDILNIGCDKLRKNEFAKVINFIFDSQEKSLPLFLSIHQLDLLRVIREKISQDLKNPEARFYDAKLYQACFLANLQKNPNLCKMVDAEEFHDLRKNFNKEFVVYSEATYGERETKIFVVGILFTQMSAFTGLSEIENGIRLIGSARGGHIDGLISRGTVAELISSFTGYIGNIDQGIARILVNRIIEEGTLDEVTSAFTGYTGNIDDDISRRLMDRMTQLRDAQSHGASAPRLDGLEDANLEAGERLPEEVPVGAGVGASTGASDSTIAGERQEGQQIPGPAGDIMARTVTNVACGVGLDNELQ